MLPKRQFGLLLSTGWFLAGCSLAPSPDAAPVSTKANSSTQGTSTSSGPSKNTTSGSTGTKTQGNAGNPQQPKPGGDCPAGQTRCAGRCVDLNADLDHCGQCGQACSGHEVQNPVCFQGECQGSCKPGFGDCNQDMRKDGCESDLRTDLGHCGACGQGCDQTKVQGGACAHGLCVGTCEDGYADCNDDLRKDGCETDLMRDPQHCGACQDAACEPGLKCQQGACVVDCAETETECSGACVTLESDLEHCGACEQACSSEGLDAQACELGECTGSCAPGRADCNDKLREDGCEIDTLADPEHCGGCGEACSLENVRTSLCSRGQCQPRCDAGYANCVLDANDGCETKVTADAQNCGFCGFICVKSGHMLDGATCEAGVCKGSCQDGYKDCNTDPSDACEVYLGSRENCGECGLDCVADLHFSQDTVTCSRPDPSASFRCGGTCQPKFGNCDGDLGNGCEADLRSDAKHCGACGNACGEGLACENERCVSPS